MHRTAGRGDCHGGELPRNRVVTLRSALCHYSFRLLPAAFVRPESCPMLNRLYTSPCALARCSVSLILDPILAIPQRCTPTRSPRQKEHQEEDIRSSLPPNLFNPLPLLLAHPLPLPSLPIQAVRRTICRPVSASAEC